ncbi:MAG: periplasmic heavy metal sensor [Verrucomicrobium sp.]|nr:periplasmic heavy metal sensor [Verrucomicrobium sp.]
MNGKVFGRIALLLVLVALVAAGSAWLTGRCQREAASDSHAALHRRLHVTPEQERRLEPVESRFAVQRESGAAAIAAANRELARALLEDRGDSPRVRAAVGKIHAAMGDLQQATLDHLFAMKGVLTPEQYDALLRLTASGLSSCCAP